MENTGESVEVSLVHISFRLEIVYNMGSSGAFHGITSDPHRHRNPKRAIDLAIHMHIKITKNKNDGEKASTRVERGRSILQTANSPMNLKDTWLVPKGTDTVQPRTTNQKIQPPHTFSQLLLSLDAVREPINPLVEMGANHALRGTREGCPLCLGDLQSQR